MHHLFFLQGFKNSRSKSTFERMFFSGDQAPYFKGVFDNQFFIYRFGKPGIDNGNADDFFLKLIGHLLGPFNRMPIRKNGNI